MRKIINCLSALFFALLVFSCSNDFNEKTGISLTLPYGSSQSVSRAVDEGVVYYFKLKLISENDSSVIERDGKSGETIVFEEILPGKYVLSCNGYISLEEEAYLEGETTVEVVAGEIAKAHLRLTPVQREEIETPEEKDPTGGEVITNPEDKGDGDKTDTGNTTEGGNGSSTNPDDIYKGDVTGGETGEISTEVSIQYKKDFYILGSEITNSDFEVKLGETVLTVDKVEIEENAFGLKVPVKITADSKEYDSTIEVKIKYPGISLDMVESGSSVEIPEGSDKALIAAKSGLKELVITPENATYTFYGEYGSNPNVQFGTVASGYEWYVKENDGEFTLATSESGTRYQPTLDIAGVYTYRCELDISKDYANGQYKDYIVDSKIVTNEYAFEVCDWEVLGFFNKGEETAPCESLTAGNTYVLKLKNKAGIDSDSKVVWKAPGYDSLVSFPEMIVSEDGQCFLQKVVIGNLEDAVEVSFSAKITDIIVEDYKIMVKPAVNISESVQFLSDLTFYVGENYLNESIVQYSSKERSLANMMNEGWTVSIADNVIDINGNYAGDKKVYEHYAGFVPVRLSKDGKDYEEKVKIDFSGSLSISYNSGTENITLPEGKYETVLADSVELFVTYDVPDWDNYDYDNDVCPALFSTAIDEWDLTIYNEIGNSSEFFAADCNWIYKQGDSVANESEIGSQSKTYNGARLLLNKPADDKNKVFSVMCECGELGSTPIGGLRFE